jgi:hypothetical protein
MSGIEASLGVAAGGAGLLSLALQLGETAVKLKRIFFSLKNAPRTVSRLVFDLETMALTLHTLEQYRQQDIHGGTLLARCITECQERTSEIQHLVGKMDQCMTKHEKFGGRVYTAFKEREVKELLSELDRAKSSLELACAMFFATRQMQRDEAYISILNQHGTLLSSLQAEISSGNANTSQQSPLLLQPETTSYPRLRTTPEMQMITNIERNTTGIFRNNEHASPPDHSPLAKKAGRKNDKDLKLIDLKLRSWFGHRIWEFTVRKAYCRWSMHLSTYNVVPGDSMIFHYAEVGDIVGIQRLIERGEGSLLDVGYARYGETLIEVSTQLEEDSRSNDFRPLQGLPSLKLFDIYSERQHGRTRREH